MKITFDVLANILPTSDKKENIKFLLSGEITNCSNSLSLDNFFILEEKGNNKKIYIDKNIITKIENARKLISSISNETKSSNLNNIIFDENNIVNLFFYRNIWGNIKSKSIHKIISDKKNEKIVINLGCGLPYKPDNNKILLIELGSEEAANNKVIYESKCKTNKGKELDVKEINVPIDKNTLTKVEVLFNFLNSNVKGMYEVICKYNDCKSISEISKAFSFSENSEELFLNIHKEINGENFNKHIEYYKKIYYEFNESAKALNQFYQDYLIKGKNNNLEENDNDQLSKMTKKIESNVESLKIQLNALKSLSISCEKYENKMKDTISNLIKKGESTSCYLIKDVQEKTNEYKNILTNCIKRKEHGFLSKIYKFFFFEKYQKHINILNDHLDKVNNILYYFENDSNRKQSVFSDNEIIKISTSILSETPPRYLLSYLYGENKKWSNFKKSLFN